MRPADFNSSGAACMGIATMWRVFEAECKDCGKRFWFSETAERVDKWHEGGTRIVLFAVLSSFLPKDERATWILAGSCLLLFCGLYEFVVSLQDVRSGRRTGLKLNSSIGK